MASRIISGRPMLALAVALPTCLLAKHAWDVYSRIQPVKRHLIVIKDDISESFRESTTIMTLVNPRDHVSIGDSHFIDLDLPKDARGVTDEMLLAAFARGFFGGKVFAPERVALQILGRDLVGFKGLRPDAGLSQLWAVSGLPRQTLPSLYSLIFGAFQVSHIQLQKPTEHTGAQEQTQSSIDIVYGGSMPCFCSKKVFRRYSKPSDLVFA